MNKVNWEFEPGLEHGLAVKERTFHSMTEQFGGLNFLELIEYLVYRNDIVDQVWVNDELVWTKEGSWIDDFLLIKVGQVEPGR